MNVGDDCLIDFGFGGRAQSRQGGPPNKNCKSVVLPLPSKI